MMQLGLPTAKVVDETNKSQYTKYTTSLLYCECGHAENKKSNML